MRIVKINVTVYQDYVCYFDEYLWRRKKFIIITSYNTDQIITMWQLITQKGGIT